jgi:hypothetical protein
MKYLFVFEINPSKKILFCIPIKITLILIAIIAIIFAILNFIGSINWAGAEKDFYFYVIQSFGFISPLFLIYTAFKDDKLTADIAYIFHTYYVILINIMYIILLLLFLIIDRKTLNKLKLGLIAQGIYNIFALFANYIFFVFIHNYSELFEDPIAVEVNQPPNHNDDLLQN